MLKDLLEIAQVLLAFVLLGVAIIGIIAIHLGLLAMPILLAIYVARCFGWIH